MSESQPKTIVLEAEIIQEETINNPSYELATVDENKFLALGDYEEKLKKLVVDNPFIEVKDKESLKIAKEREAKFRSARLELRTTGKSESQERTLLNMLKKANEFVKGKIDYLVLIPTVAEDKQKNEITAFENKEKIAKEKAIEEEKKRTDAIQAEVGSIGEALQKIIDELTFEKITASKFEFAIASTSSFNFQELAFLYEELKEEKEKALAVKVEELKSAENTRLENLKKEQEAKLNTVLLEAKEAIENYTGSAEDEDLNESIENVFKTEFDFGDFSQKFEEEKIKYIAKAKEHIEAMHLANVKTEKLRVFEIQEGMLDLINQINIENLDETKLLIEDTLKQPHMEEVKERFASMKVTVEKSLADKLASMNDALLKRKEDGLKLQKEKDKTTDMRIKLLKKVGLILTDNFLTGYGTYLFTRSDIQDMEQKKLDEIIAFMKKKKAYAEKEEARQKNLKKDKLKMSDLFLSIKESIDAKKIVFENKESEELYLTLTEQFKECIESFETIINEF